MKVTAVLILACLSAPATAGDAALATEWNETVLSIAEQDDGFLTLKGLRTATMMHLAIHDALNSIEPRYQTYAYRAENPAADPVAAATAAAYAVAADQYPQHDKRLAALRDRWLQATGATGSIEVGRELGAAAARAILAARQGDAWDREAEYRWHPMGPGVYAEFHEHSDTPQGFVFGAGWARARGFALTSPDEFRVPPPPAIGSEEYTRAYDEVREVGRFQSLRRTPDQTHLALWWKDFAENAQDRLARDLIAKEGLSLVDANRLLALVDMSIFDAYVGSFDNKFHYNHWRPYTAIRWAANDGNPDTVPEPTWTNTHRHTYAFPSYPSAHGTACAAAATAFEDVFGADYAFTMANPVVDVASPFSGKIDLVPPTRRFRSFADAADECGLSRVYLGIHFRYDAVEGVKLGREVGRNVVDRFLRRIP